MLFEYKKDPIKREEKEPEEMVQTMPEDTKVVEDTMIDKQGKTRVLNKRIQTTRSGVYRRYAPYSYGKDARCDTCYDITYRYKGRKIWEEAVGWECDGWDAKAAFKLRMERIREFQQSGELSADDKNDLEYVPCVDESIYPFKNGLTSYNGVYKLEAGVILGKNGKSTPDFCFKIAYEDGDKTIIEKVGWASEGVNAIEAKTLRDSRLAEIEQKLDWKMDKKYASGLWERSRFGKRACNVIDGVLIRKIKAGLVEKGSVTISVQKIPGEHTDNIAGNIEVDTMSTDDQISYVNDGSGWPTDLKSLEVAARDIGLSKERLLELADAGYAPHWRIDDGEPLFQIKDLRTWASKNILRRSQPRNLTLDVRQVMDPPMAVDAPTSIRYIENLRTIPREVMPGVYFLVRKGEVVYVGQSTGPMARVSSHKRDKKFDVAYMVPVPAYALNDVEEALIRLLSPVLNRAMKTDDSGGPNALANFKGDLKLVEQFCKGLKVDGMIGAVQEQADTETDQTETDQEQNITVMGMGL